MCHGPISSMCSSHWLVYSYEHHIVAYCFESEFFMIKAASQFFGLCCFVGEMDFGSDI